jgi:hypothetical protein
MVAVHQLCRGCSVRSSLEHLRACEDAIKSDGKKRSKTGAGFNSQSKKGIKVSEGPTASGLVNWLSYLVITLVSLVWVGVQKRFGDRLTKVEKRSDRNLESLHDQDLNMRVHVDMKFSELDTKIDKKLEARRLETKEDVRVLHAKIEGGHAEILRELRKGSG